MHIQRGQETVPAVARQAEESRQSQWKTEVQCVLCSMECGCATAKTPCYGHCEAYRQSREDVVVEKVLCVCRAQQVARMAKHFPRIEVCILKYMSVYRSYSTQTLQISIT